MREIGKGHLRLGQLHAAQDQGQGAQKGPMPADDGLVSRQPTVARHRAQPAAQRLDRGFRLAPMRLDILARDVGEECLVAIGCDIQDQAGLPLLVRVCAPSSISSAQRGR